MAYGPGNATRRLARQRPELGLTRERQTVQPAVMAISRPICAVTGSYVRVRYLTVSEWWPR